MESLFARQECKLEEFGCNDLSVDGGSLLQGSSLSAFKAAVGLRQESSLAERGAFIVAWAFAPFVDEFTAPHSRVELTVSLAYCYYYVFLR